MSTDRLVRTYRGRPRVAQEIYAKDAQQLARNGWVPVSERYEPGSWGCLAFLVALVLAVVLIGILILLYLLIVKPEGTLFVTYARQAHQPAAAQDDTKICPDCAETIKRDAKVCRFCGKRFAEPSASPRPERDTIVPPVKSAKLRADRRAIAPTMSSTNNARRGTKIGVMHVTFAMLLVVFALGVIGKLFGDGDVVQHTPAESAAQKGPVEERPISSFEQDRVEDRVDRMRQKDAFRAALDTASDEQITDLLEFCRDEAVKAATPKVMWRAEVITREWEGVDTYVAESAQRGSTLSISEKLKEYRERTIPDLRLNMSFALFGLVDSFTGTQRTIYITDCDPVSFSEIDLEICPAESRMCDHETVAR